MVLVEWKRQEKGGRGIPRMCCGYQAGIPGVIPRIKSINLDTSEEFKHSHSQHPFQPFISKASISHFSFLSQGQWLNGFPSEVGHTPIPAGISAFSAGYGIPLAQTQNSSQNLQVHDVTIPKTFLKCIFNLIFKHKFTSNSHWAPRSFHEGMTKISGICRDKNPPKIRHFMQQKSPKTPQWGFPRF